MHSAAFAPMFPGRISSRRSALAFPKCGQRSVPLVPTRLAKFSCCERPAWSVNVEGDKDVLLYELESKLYDAVLQEEYNVAIDTRDEITRLQSQAFVDVLQAYMAFYRYVYSPYI